MSTIVTMPQKGLTEESAVLAQWYVSPGDVVKKGDNLFSIEIGKATFDVESEADGAILALWAQEGDDVPVKAPVCAIGEPEEPVERPSFSGIGDGAAQPAPAPVPAERAPGPPPQVPEAPVPEAPTTGGPCFISPRAKAAALRRGLDYRFAVPTGPEGRIILRDIDAMGDTGPYITDAARALSGEGRLAAGTGLGGAVTSADLARPAEAPVQPGVADGDMACTVRPNSGIRKTIAQNMHRSVSELAQFTLNTSFDASELLSYRALLKARGPALGCSGISLNDMVVYATARVLKDYPEMNAHYADRETKIFTHVNMGLAVDTPRGLMVPTIFRAETRSLEDLAQEARTLAEACRNGGIQPAQLEGGTFTISNLGAMGITSFSPIIAPPQVCLLGVCGLEWKVRPGPEGQPQCYQAMGLSLTIDHRAVDGAPAARFLQTLCRALEAFPLLLAN